MITTARRRGLVALTSLAVAALTLSACTGTDSGTGGGDEQNSAAEGGELVFSNWQWLEPGRGEALWDAVSGYTQENPQAELVKSETAYGQYADKLNTELGAGEGPDVFIVLDSQFATLAEAGLVEPLDDVLEDADLNASNEELVVDGAQLGVTWEQVPYALLGNKNLLEQAGIAEMPTTIDELIAAGQAIESSTGADGFAVRHQMSEFDGWMLDFQSWAFGYGGGWSDGTNLTIDSPQNVEAVEQFKRVFDSGIMPVGDDASTFRTKFKENQLGLMIDNAGAALSFTSGGQITGEDIIAAPLPFPEPGAHQKLVVAVNANSGNKELAKDFVRWLVSEEGQTAIRPALGASTLATDVPLTDDFTTANPWAQTYVDLGANTQGTLIPGHETDTKAIMQFVMQAVERVTAQDEDPRTSLEQAQSEAGR